MERGRNEVGGGLGEGDRQKKRKSNVTYGSQLIPSQEGGELSRPAGKLLITSNWSQQEWLNHKHQQNKSNIVFSVFRALV